MLFTGNAHISRNVFHGDVVKYDPDPREMMRKLKSTLESWDAGRGSSRRGKIKDSFKDEIQRTVKKSFPEAGRKFLRTKWGTEDYQSANIHGKKKPNCYDYKNMIPAPGFVNGPPSAKFYAIHEVFTNAHTTYGREKKDVQGATFSRCPKGSRITPVIQRPLYTWTREANGRQGQPSPEYSNWFFGDIHGRKYSDDEKYGSDAFGNFSKSVNILWSSL